jgi:hypothetical protein
LHYHVWIINFNNKKFQFSKKGVSSSYYIAALNSIALSEVVGSYTLIIIRNINRDFLFKLLFIDKIEEIVDEKFPKGFILTPNLLKSFRIIQDVTRNESFVTDIFKDFTNGLSRLPFPRFREAFDFVLSKKTIRFKRPQKRELINIENLASVTNPSIFAIKLFREIIKSYNYEDIWGSKDIDNPFLNISIENIKNIPSLNYKEIYYFLNKLANGIINIDDDNIINFDYIIDLNFEDINTKKIITRKFRAIQGYIDIGETLIKTEDAERRHQDILRDISEYLISIGFIPKQTNSIDIALLGNQNNFIFEIKSISEKNILTQTSKGIIQLALYSQFMLNAGYMNVEKILILENQSDNVKINSLIIDSLKSIGVSILLYDNDKKWPNRLSPIFDFTKLL